MRLRLLKRAGALGELAEAEVAVGSKRAHPEFVGECECLAVMTVGEFRGIATGGDFSEEPEGPRLVTASTALAGKGEGSRRDFEIVVEPAGELVRLTQIREEARLVGSVPHGRADTHSMLQQRDALGNPPRERVGIAQRARACRGQEGQMPLVRPRQSAFQPPDGLAEFSLGDLEIGQTPRRTGEAVGIIEFLGEAYSFLS